MDEKLYATIKDSLFSCIREQYNVYCKLSFMQRLYLMMAPESLSVNPLLLMKEGYQDPLLKQLEEQGYKKCVIENVACLYSLVLKILEYGMDETIKKDRAESILNIVVIQYGKKRNKEILSQFSPQNQVETMAFNTLVEYIDRL